MADEPQITPVPELTLSETAAALGQDRRTVKKLIEQGVLPARIASPPGSKRPRYRIPTDDVSQLRNSYHRRTPTHGGRKHITRSRNVTEFPHIRLKLA